MSKNKSLIKPRHPIMWISPEVKNGMLEVIFVSDFGSGELLARFWIPDKKRSCKEFHNTIVKRMKHDFGYEVDHWAGLVSLKKTRF